MKFRFKTRTPIWLGNHKRKGNEIKESGILGSMRFWYEGLLRASGFEACSDRRCGSNGCRACQLFGSTAQARAFRIHVDGLMPIPLFFRTTMNKLGNSKGEAEPGNSFWLRKMFRLPNSALWTETEFEIGIHPRPGREEACFEVANLLHIMSRLGGIGAKTQYGFGQIEWRGLEEAAGLIREGQRSAQQRGPSVRSDLFTLQADRFFSHTYSGSHSFQDWPELVDHMPSSFTDPFIPIAFDIRYRDRAEAGPLSGLRPGIEEAIGGFDEKLLGRVEPAPPYGTRIHVSHPFRRSSDSSTYCIRVWGDARNSREKSVVVDAIDLYMKGRLGWTTVEEGTLEGCAL